MASKFPTDMGDTGDRLASGMANLAIGGGGGGGDRGDSDFMNMILPAIVTRPEHLLNKKGESGSPVKCLTNYVAINMRPDFKISQFHVSYNPAIDSKAFRQKLVRDRVDLFGENPVFDGMILYQDKGFKDDPLIFNAPHPLTKENVTVTVKRTKELPPNDPQCLTILNLVNRRMFEMAHFVQLGRNFYNPTSVKGIERHRIEIWPGMISAIRCHENQLLLVSEMSHKILRTDTVLHFMKSTFKTDQARGQETIMQTLIGSSVLTRYNNKTYRIDDIMWDVTPKSEFEADGGRMISFIDYYMENYKLHITDPDQPMLMSRGKRKASESGSQSIFLVPELCSMTGLTDAMRENRHLMQDLAQHTRVGPPVRIKYVRDYLTTMNRNPEATKLLSRWGVELDKDVLAIQARELDQEAIFFGNNLPVKYDRVQSDWSRECRSQVLDDPRSLTTWLIVFSQSTKAAAEEFFRNAKVLGPKSGMAVNEPLTFQTQDESVRSFLEGIRQTVQNYPKVQIVVAVVPNDNKTRYDAIKKECCLVLSLPSQVVKARSLEKNTVSVVSKILLQMNCKLGGSLWRVALPLKNTMIVGYDMYNDSSSKNKKVGAAVFSTNEQFTKWYSQCQFHGQASELVANLTGFCVNGLKKYQNVNGRLPERIILFRDGVGDGHIPVVRNDELPQIQKAFAAVGGQDYQPRFAFVVVTKRVHTRYFKVEGNTIVNPIPGTVVDDVITRPERYDFYLVPQCVRQGTVTPVSYNVIFDESGLTPTRMQLLAYKMCHMYYNWQGTIRVPAPCQFAHKLAFLVGQTLHQPVDEKLADKLFFL